VICHHIGLFHKRYKWFGAAGNELHGQRHVMNIPKRVGLASPHIQQTMMGTYCTYQKALEFGILCFMFLQSPRWVCQNDGKGKSGRGLQKVQEDGRKV
jgi:hypothetical protein